MIATLKETLISLQNRNYGQKIIDSSFQQVIWYWTKYLILVTSISLFALTAFITYFVPQFPRLVRENIPEGHLTLQDGKLSTTFNQPAVWGNQEFALILNTQGQEDDLSSFESGVLFLEDEYLVKTPQEGTERNDYSEFNDFEFTKSGLIDWLASHQSQLWLMLFLVAILFSLFFFGFYFIYRLILFFVWGLAFWIFGLILKRNISFLGATKIVVYASIVPLIVSLVLSLSPNDIIYYLGQGLFLFFGLSWIWNLPTKNTPDVTNPTIIPISRPKQKIRSTRKKN